MKGYITTSTAAAEIDCTTRHIQKLCKTGKLKAKRYGRDYLILREDWEDYKAANFVEVKVG